MDPREAGERPWSRPHYLLRRCVTSELFEPAITFPIASAMRLFVAVSLLWCGFASSASPVGWASDRAVARQMLELLAPFAPASPRSNNSACLRDSRLFLHNLERLDLRAVLMHDASGKLPSGLLNGNVNQFGDFDQCVHVGGSYCLALVDATLGPDASPTVRRMHELARSLNVFRSTLDDPGHRVPRYSSFQWGLCVPRSCAGQDVQMALEDALGRRSPDTGLSFRVRVDDHMCQARVSWTPPTSFVVVGSLILGLVLLAVFATVNDTEDSKPGLAMELVLCFSLKRNTKKLLSVEKSGDDIECVHGIRALNAYMLLLSHKSMALFFNPYINRTAMAEDVDELWTALARGASLYTDPFVMLSGLLTSYSFTKQLNDSSKINVAREYGSRLFRLVPNLATIILVCTFILPWTGSGPQWNLVVTHHSTICKQHWWRNLLFIHNYFGFENMCLTHTHHLGIDTQLFFTSPLLVYLLWRWPRGGFWTLVSLASASTFLRFYVAFTKKLTHFVYYGTSVSQLFDTANFSYILPSHRLTVYIMGLILGFYLRKCGRHFKIKKAYVQLGWMVSLAMLYASFVMPATMGSRSYVYNPLDAANYAAFAPIGICLFFMWIIFVSYINQGGKVGQMLSWRGFLVSTRLSYAVYLTQFPVFFYNVGTTRHVDQYSIRLLFNTMETGFIFFFSAALTLLVDQPFQSVRNILLKRNRTPKPVQRAETNSPARQIAKKIE